MKMHGLLRCLFALALLSAGALLMPRSAHAQTINVSCSASASNVNFGTVTPDQPTDSTSNGTVSFTCQNQSYYYVYVNLCMNIGAGNSASGNITPRDMDGGTPPPLHFQLYKDSARTQVWGSALNSAGPTPLNVEFTIVAGGTRKASFSVYGKIPGNQTGVAAGSYQNSFTGANATISGQVSKNGYPSSCGNSSNIPFPFTVSATVQPTCTVTATDLDFGSVAGLLSSGNHDGTSTISTRCINGTAYKIGLDNGQNYSNGTRHMQGPGGSLVAYELYRNSTRSLPWGNTPGTNTVDKTGTGSTQNTTVYGRVPVQTTPSPGNYSDTITVRVTY